MRAVGESGIYPTAELLDSAKAGVVGVGIAIVCDGGSVAYESADAYAGATNNTLGVAAGDQVQITVQDTGSALSARVTDITAGASTSSTANVGSHPPAYALVGVAPVIGSKKPVPVPNFNAVIFRQAMVGARPSHAAEASSSSRASPIARSRSRPASFRRVALRSRRRSRFPEPGDRGVHKLWLRSPGFRPPRAR